MAMAAVAEERYRQRFVGSRPSVPYNQRVHFREPFA
jgi:hypothetical protein